jgi:hypothetical protein
MDRDMAEHLARDTGLRPEDITGDIEMTGADEVAQHIAADTGVDEAELSDDSTDNLANAVTVSTPID